MFAPAATAAPTALSFVRNAVRNARTARTTSSAVSAGSVLSVPAANTARNAANVPIAWKFCAAAATVVTSVRWFAESAVKNAPTVPTISCAVNAILALTAQAVRAVTANPALFAATAWTWYVLAAAVVPTVRWFAEIAVKNAKTAQKVKYVRIAEPASIAPEAFARAA